MKCHKEWIDTVQQHIHIVFLDVFYIQVYLTRHNPSYLIKQTMKNEGLHSYILTVYSSVILTNGSCNLYCLQMNWLKLCCSLIVDDYNSKRQHLILGTFLIKDAICSCFKEFELKCGILIVLSFQIHWLVLRISCLVLSNLNKDDGHFFSLIFNYMSI